MTPRTDTPPPRPSVIARFGPLVAILVALGLVAAMASTGRDDADQASSTTEVGSADGVLPVSWAEAEEAGTTDDHDWGEGCDPETGRVRLPSVYAPPCLVARPDAEPGEAVQGVSEDAVKVVLYQLADDDVSAALQSVLDPPEARIDTQEKLLRMYEDVFETWGRRIEIVQMKGSGSDETSARADAVKVAEEIGAFASIGGPGQESAYAEELASRGVLCIECGLAVPDSTFQEHAPYLWGNQQTPEQFLLNLGDYVVERLLGRKAEFAGDPALRERERVFGVVHFEQDPPVFTGVQETVREEGRKRGYETEVNLSYQLIIPELGEKARTLISRLKEADVTTVIFLGDPIMPTYLTQAATQQDYFPEWVITGTVLTDTTVFGRQYDQRQWANAFGLTPTPVRVPRERAEAWTLHRWYYGEDPAASNTVAVIHPPVFLFMLGVHMAGPHLSAETFRDGLFSYPPSGGSPTKPQISFGDHGLFREPDHLSVDDMTEIWWDADATGEDEQGNDGTGMMRYARGGERYLPGEMPAGDPNAFVEEGSVLMLDDVPADERGPEYPSPKGGG